MNLIYGPTVSIGVATAKKTIYIRLGTGVTWAALVPRCRGSETGRRLSKNPPFNYAGISIMHGPNNRAPPVPRSVGPSLMHPSIFKGNAKSIHFLPQKMPFYAPPRSTKRRPSNYAGANLLGGSLINSGTSHHRGLLSLRDHCQMRATANHQTHNRTFGQCGAVVGKSGPSWKKIGPKYITKETDKIPKIQLRWTKKFACSATNKL